MSIDSTLGTAAASSTFQRAPTIEFQNNPDPYHIDNIVLWGDVSDAAITSISLIVNGSVNSVAVIDGRFQAA